MDMTPGGIHHVTFIVEDEARAKWFYEDVLALGPHSVARFNLGLAYLVDGDVIRARATYALGVRLHGAIEARRIGAVADLEKIGRLPEHAVVAQTILNELWPETTSNRP